MDWRNQSGICLEGLSYAYKMPPALYVAHLALTSSSFCSHHFDRHSRAPLPPALKTTPTTAASFHHELLPRLYQPYSPYHVLNLHHHHHPPPPMQTNTMILGSLLGDIPAVRGVLTADLNVELGDNAALRVAIGPGFVRSRQQEDAVLGQIISMGGFIPALDQYAITATGYKDSVWLLGRLVEHLPRNNRRVELHILDHQFPGYREIFSYAAGAAYPFSTLILPSNFIAPDGSLPRGMLATELRNIGSLYILHGSDHTSPSANIDKILLLLTRFNTLTRLRVSKTLGMHDIDKEIEATFHEYHQFHVSGDDYVFV
ncbi:hypothetical protein CPC08DRAFT_764137 [Agrocybe pediades]|nr:hypothetical protein CPC08DRAFT_764137 [Agrocybe pediades]